MGVAQGRGQRRAGDKTGRDDPVSETGAVGCSETVRKNRVGYDTVIARNHASARAATQKPHREARAMGIEKKGRVARAAPGRRLEPNGDLGAPKDG